MCDKYRWKVAAVTKHILSSYPLVGHGSEGVEGTMTMTYLPQGVSDLVLLERKSLYDMLHLQGLISVMYVVCNLRECLGREKQKNKGEIESQSYRSITMTNHVKIFSTDSVRLELSILGL